MANIRDLFDYDIIDRDGNEIGDVEALWRDEETGRLEFAGVDAEDTFGGGTLVVPLVNADIDDEGGKIRVPYAREIIRNAPRHEDDKDMSDREEREVYDHYGAPPIGGMRGTDADRMEPREGLERTGGEEARMQLSEEELRVGKRREEAGGVRLRKIVETEHVTEPVELRHEEIHIERVPATGERLPDDAFEEREIEMRATREEPVIGKEAHVTDEIRAHKETDVERRDVEADLRKERAEIERDGLDVEGSEERGRKRGM